MLIKDAIAFIDDLAEELDTEIGKLWEQGQGELSSELSHRYRKFEAIKEMLENYNALVSDKDNYSICREQGYQVGYLDGVRDGKQIMFNKLQEFIEGSDEDV
jgi:hypothetical protein